MKGGIFILAVKLSPIQLKVINRFVEQVNTLYFINIGNMKVFSLLQLTREA